MFPSCTILSAILLVFILHDTEAADSIGPAYDTTTLRVPDQPSSKPNLNFTIAPGDAAGASIPHAGTFFGFSLEMSIADTILGKKSSNMNVPFLNILAALTQRGGEVHIRVGGNSQEGAELVRGPLPKGEVIVKDQVSEGTGTTKTPPIQFTPELIHIMNNISSLVPAKWYLGIPFNETKIRMAIVDEAQAILGDNLLGLQAGNEPDFWGKFGRRRDPYTPDQYVAEVNGLVKIMEAQQYAPSRNKLIVPSVATNWGRDAVGALLSKLVDSFNNNVKYLAMERYPANNCGALKENGKVIDPQDIFHRYLQHDQYVRNLVAEYIPYTAFAQSKNKPFIMFETNTASCQGFQGISNSFGAALWILDYGLQMAHANFSQALLHVGGVNSYYNPFTPPPSTGTAQNPRQWTVGPGIYSALAMAEVLGTSGKSRVKDLLTNSGNPFTPAYAIYEDGRPVKMALFNYMSDSTGASDYRAEIQVPSQVTFVRVKLLRGDTVSSVSGFTWAGQTFGRLFQVDGRLQGTELVHTIQCRAGKCPITVPAPSFALVFLTNATIVKGDVVATHTFPTTADVKTPKPAPSQSKPITGSQQNPRSTLVGEETKLTTEGPKPTTEGVKPTNEGINPAGGEKNTVGEETNTIGEERNSGQKGFIGLLPAFMTVLTLLLLH